MTPQEITLRDAGVEAMRQLDAWGMNRGSTGNLSLRWGDGGDDGMLITPSGIAPVDLGPQDLVWLGQAGRLRGDWRPSSEWPLHQAIYRTRPDLHAVLHAHAVHATTLACMRRPLPAFHYMVAVAGGDDVPLVPYHLFGTDALAEAVALALTDRNACILANHGLVVAGATLEQALKTLQEIESLCEIYLKALAVGEPVLLSADQMAEVRQRFKTYGKARSLAD